MMDRTLESRKLLSPPHCEGLIILQARVKGRTAAQIISIDEKFENTTSLRKVGFERDSLTCEMSVNYDFLSNDKSISINLEEEEEEDFTFTKEVQAQTDREPENFNNTIEARIILLGGVGRFRSVFWGMGRSF